MASNEDQECDKKPFNLDDILKNWNESDDETSEDVVSPDKSEGVSMFCKACLNPYSGEPKAGTIVLKCERCGQTDVVLEERAVDLDPEEWSGNLMMNRFLQVLKEQEDLKLNIVDPFFADDDYQHLILAIQEYTFNMKAIAEKMYDIAQQARLACLHQQQLLAEVETLGENDPVEDFEADAEETDEEKWMSISTKQRLKRLGASVTKLMHSIIAKHNLPADIMDKVEHRVRHPSLSSAKGDDTTEADVASIAADNNSTDEIKDIADEAVGGINDDKDNIVHKAASGANDDKSLEDKTCGLVKDLESLSDNEIKHKSNLEEDLSAVEEVVMPEEVNTEDKPDISDNGNIEDKPDISDNGNIEDKPDFSDNGNIEDKPDISDAGNMDDKQEISGEVENDYDSDDNTPGMVLSKEKIETEIFGVLKSKFSIKFDDTEECTAEVQDNEAMKTSNECETATNSINNDTDAQIHTQIIGEAFDTENIGKEANPDDDDDEELQVNFYSISSAFINELQSRKRTALMARKDKALKIVHQKIVGLKQEVENVENRVHDELTRAYKKKLKKVENQRKQLDKRHETIQDVEQLLNHYARTGQNDKLAELMEQLDIQYEN